jgi:hypothetical protein
LLGVLFCGGNPSNFHRIEISCTFWPVVASCLRTPRDRATWRCVGKKLDDAARGGGMTDVAVSLQIALHLEGVECRAE